MAIRSIVSQKFKDADAFVAKWEGGNVDHPKDPGGRTSRGVTQAVYNGYRKNKGQGPKDVYTMSEEERLEIYKKLYWDKVWGDELPDGMDVVVYDPAVNSGPSRGVRWFQEALIYYGAKIAADGGMGSKTAGFAKQAVGAGVGVDVIKKACAQRMGFLRGLKTFVTFGKGWSRRVAELEAFAVARYVRSGAAPTATLQAEEKAARNTARAQGGSAAGSATAGTTVPVTDYLSTEVIVIVGVILAALIVVLVMKARHNSNRAEAYKKESRK